MGMDQVMRYALLLALLFLPACGGSSSPTSPSPAPSPSPGPTRISGTITDTLTGASVGTFSSEAATFPARVSVSAAGYVTRETWVRSASPTVDLIPESSFNLGFFRQFARGSLEGSVQPLRVLSQAPNIYLQTAGLSASHVAALEAAAREVVPALTGGKFQVQAWDTGEGTRPPTNGWIVISRIDEPTGCGRATVGSPAGQIWINFGNDRCDPGLLSTLRHELGHALGFYHVEEAGSLMKIPRPVTDNQPTALERRHAAIAYHRSAGNQDVDVDP